MSAAPAAPARGLVALACIVAALPSIMHVLAQALYAGVVPDLRDALDTGSAGVGMITAAFGVPGVLLLPIAGMLVDRLGSRRALTAATVGYGACCVWLGMSESVLGSSAARFSMGACAAFLYPGFMAVVVHLVAPPQRPKAIGLMQLSSGVAAITGTLLAAQVLAGDHWRLAIGATMLLALPVAVTIWVLMAAPSLRGNRDGGPAAPAMSIGAILALPDVRRACVAAAATGGVLIGMGGLLNLLTARLVWQLPEGDWGKVNAAFFVGFAVGAPVMVRIARSLGNGRTLFGSLVFLAASLAAWACAPAGLGIPVACVVTLCCGIGASSMALAIAAGVRAVPPDAAGATSGVVLAGASLGGLSMQFGAMSTTLIPGTTVVGRVHGCAAVIIAFVLFAAAMSRGIGRGASATA